MRKNRLFAPVLIGLWLIALAGCGASPAAQAPAAAAQAGKTYKDLVIGYAQIGAESEWRTANTQSIQETALQLGVQLKFYDAQQKQENQIKAIRSFIAPVVETGWDEVFKEVKDAGIPLILVDRHAKVADDMFTAFIGSDFRLEGEKACREMGQLLGGPLNSSSLSFEVGTI